MSMHSCCRYRQAFIWEDKTVNYFSETVRGTYRGAVGVRCAVLGVTLGQVSIVRCQASGLVKQSFGNDWSVCQTPDRRRDKYSQPFLPSAAEKTWPTLAKVNTTIIGNSTQWSPVTCPRGHVTHVFLACDVSTFCGAGRNVTFSLLPELWALPAPQSCQAWLSMTPLPPSFLCRSEEQRVPYSLVCDHRRDCADDSDEKFCTFLPCQWQSQFQCLNKQVCCVQSQSKSYALICHNCFGSFFI